MANPIEATEAALLARAQGGDKAALESLLEREQARVYRFGMRMCRHPQDAEDVLQETLLAMARGIKDFHGASSLSTWLYTIARSHCIKKRRRSKYAPEAPRSLETEANEHAKQLVDGAPQPDVLVDERRMDEAVEEAIGSLDPKYREVLVLRDIEGLSAPEVAEVLSMSVAAVKTRLHRARLAVREKLAPLIGGDTEAPASKAEPCPDILSLFSSHLEGEIDGGTCARMERHVAECPRCSAKCDSLKRTLALCRTHAEGAPVPLDVQKSVRSSIRELLAEGV